MAKNPYRHDEAARRMQAFYEPAYFGRPTAYGEALSLANTAPTTMGGFQYMPEFDPSLPSAPGFTPADSARLATDYQTRQLFDRPNIGPTNLSMYGKGQLGRYGKGALAAYGPLTRESDLRWR